MFADAHVYAIAYIKFLEKINIVLYYNMIEL